MTKKTIFTFLAASIFLFFSCRKENTLPEPKLILIKSVEIKKNPLKNDKYPWDKDGFPDLYFIFDGVSTDTLLDIEKTTNITLTFKKPIEITALSDRYDWTLNDWDENALFGFDDEISHNNIFFNQRRSNNNQQVFSYGGFEIWLNVDFQF